jgi:hypothetical protein
MTRESFWRIQRLSLCIEKASSPGSQNHGGKEGSSATSKVDNTTTRKIDSADTKEGIGVRNTQKTVVGPNRVGNNGVNKTSQKDRVT